ncbi:hypothetical protein MalM25_28870 [Planctomycetes bacterium MalM25]|nr:hypothetical protein MalM25_28870 [Planctomycetes bacterium MalM25]
MPTEPKEIRLARPAAGRSVAPTVVRDEAFAAVTDHELAPVAPSTEEAAPLSAALRRQLATLRSQQEELADLLAKLGG